MFFFQQTKSSISHISWLYSRDIPISFHTYFGEFFSNCHVYPSGIWPFAQWVSDRPSCRSFDVQLQPQDFESTGEPLVEPTWSQIVPFKVGKKCEAIWNMKQLWIYLSRAVVIPSIFWNYQSEKIHKNTMFWIREVLSLKPGTGSAGFFWDTLAMDGMQGDPTLDTASSPTTETTYFWWFLSSSVASERFGWSRNKWLKIPPTQPDQLTNQGLKVTRSPHHATKEQGDLLSADLWKHLFDPVEDARQPHTADTFQAFLPQSCRLDCKETDVYIYIRI